MSNTQEILTIKISGSRESIDRLMSAIEKYFPTVNMLPKDSDDNRLFTMVIVDPKELDKEQRKEEDDRKERKK